MVVNKNGWKNCGRVKIHVIVKTKTLFHKNKRNKTKGDGLSSEKEIK